MDNKKPTQSEFWIKEEWSCSAEEAEHFSSPEQVSLRLFKALNDWQAHANAVLKAHGFTPYLYGAPEAIPHHVANGPLEVQDAFDVLQRTADTRKRMRSQLSGVEVFDLAYAAIRLGLAVGKAHVRKFEKPAESGRRSAKGASDAGKERRKQFDPRRAEWQRLAARHWDRNPKVSKRTVARLIAKETGDKFETIRKNLGKTRHLPK